MMQRNRLEAFSDGVIAIIITIMVLELKAPRGDELSDLLHLTPIFFSYLLSFVYIAIYWNNHHHMLHTVKHVNGLILWANIHFLFWLSLIPFATAWVDENHYVSIPTAFYGFALLMCAIAYYLLQMAIIHSQGEGSLLKKAVGKDIKGHGSLLLYLLAIGVAFIQPIIACVIFVAVAILWLVPDSRIEKILRQHDDH